MTAMEILQTVLLILLTLPLMSQAVPVPARASATPIRLGFRVIRDIPHRREAFTQGLIWQNGSLLESTGRYGLSHVARINPADGSVLDLLPLPAQYFGEGIALGPQGDLLVLTWLSRIAIRLQSSPLAILEEKPLLHSTQGWGLTQWQGFFLASDGSSALYYLHPETLRPLQTLKVTFNGKPVPRLNELEVVNPWVAANVWMDNRVLFIHPRTGEVGAYLDLSSLTRKNQTDPEAVLNGLAWDPTHPGLWVTGKLWNHLYLLDIQGLPQS